MTNAERWSKIVNDGETRGEQDARVAAEDNASVDLPEHTDEWYARVLSAREELLESGEYDY